MKFTSVLFASVIALMTTFQGNAQHFLPIWEKGHMPNTKGMQLEDSISNERVFRVGTPGMYAFLPPVSENRRTAVLILPGGGYERLAYIASGTQIAKWFNTLGISAFVLNYRLPNSPDLQDRTTGPIMDAQRALKYIRAHAAEWNIDSNKIGVLGCSAGGHLAATAGTATKDFSEVKDETGSYAYKPDFMILISPVMDLGAYAHQGSRKNLLGENASAASIAAWSPQLHVDAHTPPAFIVHAADDRAVNPKNSILFFEALQEQHIPASLHIFPKGGHNINISGNPGSTQQWTLLCREWLLESGFLK